MYLSACGHFAVVGALGGAIFKYNLQSGERRGSFPTSATPKAALIRSLMMPGLSYKEQSNNHDHNKNEEDRIYQHKAPVTGVAVDATNQILVSSSLDGMLKFWDFSSHAHVATLDLATPLSHLCLHREAHVVVVACEDLILRVYDMATRKLIRRFTGHTHQVTDVSITPDARWILSSSRDGSVRVWDVPSGKCVDWIQFQHAVTSICVSPKAEFFATTHVGQQGIYLWANRSVVEHVFLDTVPETPVRLGMPIPLSEVEVPLEHNVMAITEAEVMELHGHDRMKQDGSRSEEFLSPLDKNENRAQDHDPNHHHHHYGDHSSMITLSRAPKAMWQSLFQLELIKARNKPKEAPKAPEKAPFFLPTVRKEDVHPTFERVCHERGGSNLDASTIESVQPETESGRSGGQDPAMMSVWVDDDEDDEDDEEDVDADVGIRAKDEDDALHTDKQGRASTTTTTRSRTSSSSSSLAKSRIGKSTGLANIRSKLATLLEQCAARPEVLGGSVLALSPPWILSANPRADKANANAYHPHLDHPHRFDAVLAYLQSLSPSSVDVELSTLCMGDFDEEGKIILGLFLTCLLEAVQGRQEFQVVQVYLNRFLKVHEDVLAQDTVLLERVVELHTAQQQAWEHLQSLLLNSMCLVQHFSNIQM